MEIENGRNAIDALCNYEDIIRVTKGNGIDVDSSTYLDILGEFSRNLAAQVSKLEKESIKYFTTLGEPRRSVPDRFWGISELEGEELIDALQNYCLSYFRTSRYLSSRRIEEHFGDMEFH